MQKLSSSENEDFNVSIVSSNKKCIEHEFLSESNDFSKNSEFFNSPFENKKSSKDLVIKDQKINFKNSRIDTPAFASSKNS